MAIDFSAVQVQFSINGVQVINNSVVTGIINGTTREADLSVRFIGSIGAGKVKCQVLDEKGKEVSVNFNEATYTGKFLFNGTYTVKVTLYEEVTNAAPNEKLFVLSGLKVTGCYTTLSSFSPDIVNKNTGIIINNDDIFSNGEQIIPDLSQELPFDFQLDEYSLTRNGLVLAYDPFGDRTIKDDGEYFLKITVRRRGSEISGDIMVKSFTRRFKIELSFINTIGESDIRIFNRVNNTDISNAHKYIEKSLILDWEVSNGIQTKSAILNFYPNAKIDNVTNNNGVIEVDADFPPILLGDFEKSATILSRFGVYKLDLVLSEFSNSKNKLSLTRYFTIERAVVTLDSTLIQCYDANHENTISDTQDIDTVDNFLTTQEITPYITYDEELDDRAEMDVVALRDGLPYDDFINGKTILNKQGVYTLTGRIFEPGAVNKNNYTRTYNFTIVEPPINLENMNIILVNKESGQPVTNGHTYEANNTNYNFIVNKVKDFDVSVYYEYTSTTGLITNSVKTLIDSAHPLTIKDPGRYLVKLSIQDATINPATNELQYPYNKYEKTYVFNIFNPVFTNANDPNKMIYINGQLLDPDRVNPIWNSLSEDSTELNFSIVIPGSYNIVLLNKNNFNFNYTINDYDIIVVDPTMQQRPTIISDPPSNVSAAKSFMVYITYPISAAKNSMMYRDDNADDKSWQVYPKEGILCTKECKIFGRYQDMVSGDWIENLEGEAFTPGPMIDNNPVDILDTDIIGIVNNGRYYAVTVGIKRKLNYKYTPSIKLPGATEFTPCELGDIFRTPGTYYLKISAENTINGNTGSTNDVRFVIDHTVPDVPVIILRDDQAALISDNGRTTGSVNITLGNVDYSKYLYEGYLNNRLLFKTISTSTSINIPKVMRDGAYYLTVVAVDKSSGRRSMVHGNFTIASQNVALTGVPIKPHRYQLTGDTYTFKDNIKPYDGELLLRCDSSWNPVGDIGIYRDGLILNKLIELDNSVLQLQLSTDGVESDIILNRTVSDSLSSIKRELYYSLLRMMIENAQLDENVSSMLTYCENTTMPELDPAVSERLDSNLAYSSAKTNTPELNDLGTKTLVTSRNALKQVITNLQQNANMIGELNYLSALYKVKNKIYD